MNVREYPNPLVERCADPWIYRHTDGRYYFTATAPQYDRIELRVADTIAGLRDASPAVVWRKHDTGSMSCLIWAPEIHFVRNRWYIYFAAAPTVEMHPIHNTFRHRMFVLEADDPIQGHWLEKGQIETGLDSFCLDATVFENQDKLYYVWAQKDPQIMGNSNLYISEMENPWTLKGPRVLLTKPEFEWECSVIPVNEGPAVLCRDGRLYLTYSANATGAEYCVGLLTAAKDSDLLSAASWKKSAKPVFRTNRKNGRYGPGHNSFTVAEDGKTPLIVYHARDYEQIQGDPLDNPDRHTCVQPISFTDDGIILFGEPLPRNHR